MLVYITTEREIGERCKDIARSLLPFGWGITENPDECDVYFSCFSKRILDKEFLDNHRCYNFHLGILPEYRGSGTYAWAIINGEKEIGVTFHEMDEGIDTGDIIDIERFSIGDTDTSDDLLANGASAVATLFFRWFNKILDDDYQAVPQVDRYPLYTSDMLNEKRDLTRLVRALTIAGKEKPYYINKAGERVYLG